MSELYENFAKEIISNIFESTISTVNDKIEKIEYDCLKIDFTFIAVNNYMFRNRGSKVNEKLDGLNSTIEDKMKFLNMIVIINKIFLISFKHHFIIKIEKASKLL